MRLQKQQTAPSVSFPSSMPTGAIRLSGGQVQRVRFVAAFVSNPSLIVLDEPTVALEVENRLRQLDSLS